MLAFLNLPLLYIGHPILGYIIPALILILSFWVAFSLFRHFTKE